MLSPKRLALTISFCSTLLIGAPEEANAAAGVCSACFASGYAAGTLAGCAHANGDCTAGMNMIKGALTASERALLAAMGMEPNTGLIGFPALAGTISAADALTTRNIVETLDWSQKRIIAEIRRVPDTQNTLDIERKTGEHAPDYSTEGCAAIDRGIDYDITAPSGLKAARNWRNGAGVLSTAAEQEADDNSVEASSPEERTAIDTLVSSVELASRYQINDLFDTMRSELGDETDIAGELNGGLMIADSNIVFDYEDEFSSGALADYFSQLSVADTISDSAGLAASPTGPAMVADANRARTQDLRYDMIYTIWSRYADMRKPKYETTDSVDYMLEMTGGEVPEQGISDEFLLKLSSTFRSQSPEWKEKVSVDSQFTNVELAQMEADILHLKYRRWLVRRDINILMSQLLAAELRDE